MTLYSLNRNYPASLPNRIRLSGGFTKTDSTTFTEEDISDAGYVIVSDPPPIAWPNQLGWDSSTLSWISIPPSEEEINKRKIIVVNELNDNLNRINNTILTKIQNNESVDSCETEYKNNLNALLLQVDSSGFDLFNVNWPRLVYPDMLIMPDSAGEI